MDIRTELQLGKNIYELPLRVCYYARVSTEHELQATSIVNQVDYFQKYIKNFSNWTLIKGYVDEGISGKATSKRENFLKMIQDGEKHNFDLILTKSVSRFARNTIDSIYYTTHLLEYGIGVIFLNDNINTFYSDSEFRLTLMASIAQDELRKLSESVKFGLRQSINRGIVLGNDNLLGYQKKKGKLIINQDEAKIVQDIFSLFVINQFSYRKISKWINQKYTKQFDSTSIKRILTNYKYKGYYCGRKTEVIDYKKGKRQNRDKNDWIIYQAYDIVPPIIEEKIWDKTQTLIDLKKQAQTKSPYAGKVFCQIHQQKMLQKKKTYKEKIYYYFKCPHCGIISEKILNKINKYTPIETVTVTFQNDIKLKIRHRS